MRTILALSLVIPCWGGFGFSRTITVDHTKVPNTDQANFPFVISGTFAELATVSNGGKIQHTTTQTGGGASITVPADYVVTSDSGCTTKLNWEFETYNSTTGAVNIWVKAPSLSHTTDTVLHECFGDASTTTWQGNVNGTWDSNFKGVWHWPDGTTLTLKDSTSNANDGTNVGPAIAGAGVIDGDFDGNTGSFSTVGTLGLTTTFTFSLWIHATNATFGAFFGQQPRGGVEFRKNNNNTLSLLTAQNANLATSSGSITTGAYHHVALTYDGTTANFYIDGAASGTTATSFTFGSATYDIGTQQSASETIVGRMDEARASNSIRSADWIATEFNSMNSPSTFITLGPLAPTKSSGQFPRIL